MSVQNQVSLNNTTKLILCLVAAMNTFLFDMNTSMKDWMENGHCLDMTLIKSVGRMKMLSSLHKIFLGTGDQLVSTHLGNITGHKSH